MSMLMQVAVFLGGLSSPKLAATFVGSVYDRPDLGRELVHICMRESRCQDVGPHAIDRKWSRTMWERAVKVGWLQPKKCKHHRYRAAKTWSVSGPWGLSRAYHLRFVGCVPARWLDVPIVGAYAAMKKMLNACRVYGACDQKSRHRVWAGKKKELPA